MKSKEKIQYTVKEIADLLGISRVAVFNKIKNKQIKAKMMGKTRVIAETGAYAAGGGEAGVVGLAAALPDLWDEAETAYARKSRQRVV